MFGFGAEPKLHWIVSFVGYALINVVTSVTSIAMTYVMDSFEVAGEALLLINGMSKVIAWAFTYGSFLGPRVQDMRVYVLCFIL